jgi:hypothetical protein
VAQRNACRASKARRGRALLARSYFGSVELAIFGSLFEEGGVLESTLNLIRR